MYQLYKIDNDIVFQINIAVSEFAKSHINSKVYIFFVFFILIFPTYL